MKYTGILTTLSVITLFAAFSTETMAAPEAETMATPEQSTMPVPKAVFKNCTPDCIKKINAKLESPDFDKDLEACMTKDPKTAKDVATAVGQLLEGKAADLKLGNCPAVGIEGCETCEVTLAITTEDIK